MWHSLLPIFKRERGLVCQAGVWFGVSFAVEMGLVLLWATQHHRPQSWALGHWEWEEVASERPPGSCFLCMPRAVGVTVFHMIMRPQLGKVALCPWDWWDLKSKPLKWNLPVGLQWSHYLLPGPRMNHSVTGTFPVPSHANHWAATPFSNGPRTEQSLEFAPLFWCSRNRVSQPPSQRAESGRRSECLSAHHWFSANGSSMVGGWEDSGTYLRENWLTNSTDG